MKKILIIFCLLTFLTSCAGFAGGFAAGSIQATKKQESNVKKDIGR